MTAELSKVMAKAKECQEDARFLMKDNRYDAMFTAIQRLLLSKGILAKTHAGAKAKFHELFLKTELLPIHLGKIFEDTLLLRQEADYEFDIDVTKEDAQQTIDDADTFITEVVKFLH